MHAPDIDLPLLEKGDPVPMEWAQSLLIRARTVRARKGQLIIAQNSPSSEVYYISKGRVQFSLLAKSGRESILRELGAGHIFGELSAIDMQPRSANVTAIDNCELAQISAQDFRSFLSDVPAAGLWVMQQLARRTRSLTEKIFELATMSVSSRLHIELLRLSLENGINSDVATISPLPTHSALAARIGSHREAVTRELGLLADDGIVKQSGRQLTISSVQKLQKLLSRTR